MNTVNQQPTIRKVMRPPKGDNITYAQARRAWITVMRREEERKRAAARAGAGQREAHGAEA